LPWSRTRCTIRFGPPIPATEGQAGGSNRYEQHTDRLRSAVAGMWDALEAERADPYFSQGNPGRPK
jgi:hypothetical protein